MEKIDEIKIELLKFTTVEVEKFLRQNPGKVFYGFAFDCNTEYAEVNLSFNTEEDFETTLQEYQQEDPNDFQDEEDILQLKYNPGDWTFLCIATTYVFTESELDEKYNDGEHAWEKFLKDLMDVFTSTLIEFSKTKSFEKIPKTKDFKFFCIDHDENFEDAEKRLQDMIKK